MKKLLLLFIFVPVFFSCDYGSNEYTGITGLWTTTDTAPEDTALITRDAFTGKFVVRFMVITTSGGTTIEEIHPCSIDMSDASDISEPYTYNLDGIELTVTFSDYDNATVRAVWDYDVDGLHASGSKEYTLVHQYQSFRYTKNDDLIFNYFGK